MILTNQLKNIKSSIKTNRVYYFGIVFMLAFFILKTIELALSIQPGIAPDEPEHMKIVLLYSKFALFIQEFPEMYVFGPITYTPYLYYLLMGKMIHTNFMGIDELIFIRFVNIIFSILTVIFSLKLAGLVTNSRLVKLLTVIIITNIPMFTFLSGMVNYDNLANLFAVISTYFLVHYYKYNTKTGFLGFIIFTSLGLITKITIIPLAVISTLIIVVITVSRIPSRERLKQNYVSQLKKPKPFDAILVLITIFTSILVINLYGKNIIRYRAITPDCYQVTTYENCQLNPAIRGAEELSPPETLIDPYHYIPVWASHMYDGTFGIFGQQKLFKSPILLIPYKLIISIALIGFIRIISFKNKPLVILSVISLFYILVLMYYQNYESYRISGMTFFAVHGRYLFPVLAPLAILIAYSLINLFKNFYLQIIITVLVATVFIFGDYIYFKRNVPDEWYRDTNITRFIKETNNYFRY